MAAGDLVTITDVRTFLRLDAAQTDMNVLLTAFIAQASKAIMRFTGREFAPLQTGTATRVFAYTGGGRLFFAPFDLRSVESVLLDTDTGDGVELVADTDYFLHPRTPATGGVYEWMELRGCEPAKRSSVNVLKPWREITIEGSWGFDEVPADIEVAACMLVAHWYRNQSAIPGRDMAGEGDRLGPVSMPSAVLQLLSPYRVIGFGAGA